MDLNNKKQTNHPPSDGNSILIYIMKAINGKLLYLIKYKNMNDY